jgi:hypothetical protein
MAVILIKEKYIPFITAVHDNSDLQNAIRMNVEDSRIDKEFSDFVSQYAIQFLSN